MVNKLIKFSVKISLTLVMAFATLTFFSQDGEKLFKANCASCHNPVKNATGPKMQGVLQK